MDLLNNELELIELALEAALLQLYMQHKYTPDGDVGNLTKDLTKLSNRITKELAERIAMDKLQFEQLAAI